MIISDEIFVDVVRIFEENDHENDLDFIGCFVIFSFSFVSLNVREIGDLYFFEICSVSPYAQAGFNAGDGVISKMLKYSRTENITLLVNESNVNVPGLFAFRIDTANIEAGGCNEHESLNHLPIRGSQIGGTSVYFQGPCFNSNTTEIQCRFGEFGVVDGLILSEFRAICISPLAAHPGNVELTVSFDGGNTFLSSGVYTYMPMTDDAMINEQILVRQDGDIKTVIDWDAKIEVEWMFSEVSLANLSSENFVVIEYEILTPNDESTRRKEQRVLNSDVDIQINAVIPLASNIPLQSGRQTIQINLAEISRRQFRMIPVTGPTIGIIRLGIFINRSHRIARQMKSAMILIQKTSEYICDTWKNNQPAPSTWNQNLLPCPNRLDQARVARAQYVPDPMCQPEANRPFYIPSSVNCWFHQGRPRFQEENAVACFRSVRFNEHNAGGQCCYSEAGHLIRRGSGAGSDDRYHSDKAFWKHQFHDVLPYIACCKSLSDPERCNLYFHYRPSRPGSDTMGQFGGTWGDPHFLTLDGTAYTFNGYGEYIYLAISEQQSTVFDSSSSFRFESQIRTTPIESGTTNATAIKAFAAKIGLQNISVTVSRRNQLLVHLNGDELAFDNDLNRTTLQLEEFSITKTRANNQLTILCRLGVHIQITPIFITTKSVMVLNVGAAISGELKGNWTFGLIGSYDGNPSNDLRDSSGNIVGTTDTLSTEQIHQLFGMTWAIDPVRSHFYYESGDNASFYSFQNQIYRPTFNVSINSSNDSNARDACGILSNATDSSLWSFAQRTCYYDIAVTGDIAFGRSSRQTAEQQFEQREAMRNSPKFNSDLSLTRSVRVGEQVQISFQATSEFSLTIHYKLLHAPNGSSLDGLTGEFNWKVPDETEISKKIPVEVSAQDATYNLTSTYEVLLEIQPKSNALALATSIILLTLTFVSSFVLPSMDNLFF
ncbi:unnamed protein product [Adineta ricciae]|uniref:Uncharacterized protein n=2 Tax=Adineta ricciae TaxID=249248 RepID=A0A815C5J2_ADIRI|nr:unnamed protein product [Adineta ricciae]